MNANKVVISVSSGLLGFSLFVLVARGQRLEPSFVSAAKEAKLVLLVRPTKMVDRGQEVRAEVERFWSERPSAVKLPQPVVPTFSIGPSSPRGKEKESETPEPPFSVKPLVPPEPQPRRR